MDDTWELTEQTARIIIATRAQAGTSTNIAKRAGVVERSTRRILIRLIEAGRVEKIMTWPATYQWIDSDDRPIQEAWKTVDAITRAGL